VERGRTVGALARTLTSPELQTGQRCSALHNHYKETAPGYVVLRPSLDQESGFLWSPLSPPVNKRPPRMIRIGPKWAVAL
jgi:hypothetical protein